MTPNLHTKALNGGSLKKRFGLASIIIAASLRGVSAHPKPTFEPSWQRHFLRRGVSSGTVLAKKGPPEDREEQISLVVSNHCDNTLWPGVATQAGTGPGTGGFELEPGEVEQLWVSPDWQGRVWGRTNCTVDSDEAWCETGDCFGKLDCEFSVGCRPGFSRTFANAFREQHQRPWPSSRWRAVTGECKPSTTSPW